MHSFLRFGKESPVAKNMKKWGMGMVTLNDYLYSGDTVLKIIQRLRKKDASARGSRFLLFRAATHIQ